MSGWKPGGPSDPAGDAASTGAGSAPGEGAGVGGVNPSRSERCATSSPSSSERLDPRCRDTRCPA
eukprot:12263921-Alexandrium_andersonii.AAC.1